ncbi:MAG: hypothetical protein KKE62_01740 [Proteobacteria bacterium]|nr:hypothetical protein [Pseudomonadota bacterium]MBU1387140.1 hypothetical protein [Pseudomonadota bacterium]MBU1541543.1 hypothetical protein [Pseudomonadota bacterium]MBU2430254.1 hypothetical protein [Pseudomonadota bacterium]MBU2480049.1 hypothetical protein [Pseudomonadota bacterium]
MALPERLRDSMWFNFNQYTKESIMGRPKKEISTGKAEETVDTSETETKTTASTQAIENQDQLDTEIIIRILYHGRCPKLTSRGQGDLEYELGVNDVTDESYIRIAGNHSSGAFNHNWIALNEIRSILDNIKEQSFRAVALQNLYSGQSSNNHGYLGAILKAEGVVVTLQKQPALMQLGVWDTLLGKIDSLKKTEVSLTDYIAVAAEERLKKIRDKRNSAEKSES